MLGSRAASHLNHCISATNIDHLITESQLAMKSKDPRHSSEKDQIESIRKMASFMLE
jgi:Cft2 family RNA processing exonuclease